MALNWGLESPQNPQAGMPALQDAGDFSVAHPSALNNVIKNRGQEALERGTGSIAIWQAPVLKQAGDDGFGR
jgi:hypothetical protein